MEIWNSKFGFDRTWPGEFIDGYCALVKYEKSEKDPGACAELAL